MANVTFDRLSAPIALPVRLVYALESFKKNLRQRRMFNQTYRELSELSDRDLNDLGLNRSMIRATARGAVYN